MNTKVQIIETLQTQATELNTLEEKIFLLEQTLETFEKELSEKTATIQEQVMRQSEDELFKKELSNETKRQIKLKSELRLKHSDLLNDVETLKEELAKLQHSFSLMNRLHSTLKVVARLLSDANND